MTDLEFVEQNGYNIQLVVNPSIEVQLAAVKQNGYSIRYIKNPSLEVQLAAVEQDTRALKFTTSEFKELYPEYFL